MINYKICGVHEIKMQPHKKKIKKTFFTCVCLFKKKEFDNFLFHEQLLITSIF